MYGIANRQKYSVFPMCRLAFLVDAAKRLQNNFSQDICVNSTEIKE